MPSTGMIAIFFVPSNALIEEPHFFCADTAHPKPNSSTKDIYPVQVDLSNLMTEVGDRIRIVENRIKNVEGDLILNIKITQRHSVEKNSVS